MKGLKIRVPTESILRTITHGDRHNILNFSASQSDYSDKQIDYSVNKG
jgi:hypothetical protein